MSAKREVINVQVSRRVLWIGGQAYPLHNIARAQTIKIVPRRGAAFWRWLKAVVFWAILGVGAVVAIGFAGASDSTSGNLRAIVTVVVLVLVIISSIRLIRNLSESTLYALIIETAGAQHTALASKNQGLMNELVHMIMVAIDNPAAEFQMSVENFHVGDKITQFGDQSVGKVAR